MKVEKIGTGKDEVLRFTEDKEGIFYQGRMMPRLDVLVRGRWISENSIEFTQPAGAEPLSAILKKPMRKEMLERILSSLEESVGLLESYLLDKEKLWWDPEWTFYDAKAGRTCLIYLPWDADFQGPGIEKQFCRYLWLVAARQGWDKDLWESVGRFSVRIYGDENRKEEKRLAPEKEKALDELMEEPSFLPPFTLKTGDDLLREEVTRQKSESKHTVIPRWLSRIRSFLHGW